MTYKQNDLGKNRIIIKLGTQGGGKNYKLVLSKNKTNYNLHDFEELTGQTKKKNFNLTRETWPSCRPSCKIGSSYIFLFISPKSHQSVNNT